MSRIRRGRIPAVLLSDWTTVEAYRAWNTWAPGKRQKCLIDEGAGQSVTGSGTVIGRTLRVFYPPEADIPEGSRITLPDGRVGYAAVVAPRGLTTPLPVPAHLEVAVRLGAVAPSPIGGETVIVLRRTVTGIDAYGNDVYEQQEVAYTGCAVGTQASDSTGEPGNKRVTRRRTVVLPPDSLVKATDRLVIRGEQWGIDGEPQQVEEPTLGLSAGVVVQATRTTG